MGNITERYPEEVLGEYDEDDGTMPANVSIFRDKVVGRKIVSAEYEEYETYWGTCATTFVIKLDNGKQVRLVDTEDCCAFTELKSFLLNPELVDHVITGVGTERGYSTWHIYADLGDVLTLDVIWSSGNPFYYGYGFAIKVEDIEEENND